MAKALALVLAAGAAVASARFPDQVSGERVRRHVGPVTAAVSAAGSRALVTTAANVLALLDVRTGEPVWRAPQDGACRRRPAVDFPGAAPGGGRQGAAAPPHTHTLAHPATAPTLHTPPLPPPLPLQATRCWAPACGPRLR